MPNKTMTQEISGHAVFTLAEGHRMPVYQTGIERGAKLVFMSGSGTVSPVLSISQEIERFIARFGVC